MSHKTSQLILGAILAGLVSFGHNLEAIAQQLTITNSDDISMGEMLKKKNKPHKNPHNDRNRNDNDHDNDDDDDDRDYHQGNNNKLPGQVKNAIRQDLARILAISPGKVKIKNVTQQNWPNSCLGLARRDEFCAQVIVTGWRVEAFYNQQKYVYRTNNNGKLVRLENGNNTGNPSGDNPQTTNIKISRIYRDIPTVLPQGVIFRNISVGGIAGKMYETTLTNDGKITRFLINGNSPISKPEIWYISGREVVRFQELLQQRELRSFNMYSYAPSRNAADYITMTITSENWTIRYADIIANDLPNSLREVAVFWQEISRTR